MSITLLLSVYISSLVSLLCKSSSLSQQIFHLWSPLHVNHPPSLGIYFSSGEALANINTNSAIDTELLLPLHQLDNTAPKSARSVNSLTNRTARAVDWRGQITPTEKKAVKYVCT